jgi:hypothetical protein
LWSLRFVMLKDRVQANDCYVRQRLAHPLHLRDAVRNTTAAQHLKHFNQHDPAAQRREWSLVADPL